MSGAMPTMWCCARPSWPVTRMPVNVIANPPGVVKVTMLPFVPAVGPPMIVASFRSFNVPHYRFRVADCAAVREKGAARGKLRRGWPQIPPNGLPALDLTKGTGDPRDVHPSVALWCLDQMPQDNAACIGRVAAHIELDALG